MKIIEIGKNEENQRLDKFLFRCFNDAPKSFIYKMLRKKRIKLNSGKAEGSEMLREGDKILMRLSEETMGGFMSEREIAPAKKGFGVIYEDENILIVQKPAGLLCHPGAEGDRDTLIDQILFYLASKGDFDPSSQGFFTPALANRLDRNTSGIVLCGKNLPALQDMNRAIAEKKVEKLYLALVLGKVLRPGVLKGLYVKDGSKNKAFAVSDEGAKEVCLSYRPLKNSENYSLLEVNLITGRSHQIRLQLKEAGHPIAGDRKYGDPAANSFFREEYGISNQFLHAESVKWLSDEGPLSYLYGRKFEALLPAKLREAEKNLFDR